MNDVADYDVAVAATCGTTTAHVAIIRKPPPVVSVADKKEHEASDHVAHISWRAHCVAARASMHPHLAAPLDPPDDVARMCIDCFLKGDEEHRMCLLVVKDTITKMATSSVVE